MTSEKKLFQLMLDEGELDVLVASLAIAKKLGTGEAFTAIAIIKSLTKFRWKELHTVELKLIEASLIAIPNIDKDESVTKRKEILISGLASGQYDRPSL